MSVVEGSGIVARDAFELLTNRESPAREMVGRAWVEGDRRSEWVGASSLSS